MRLMFYPSIEKKTFDLLISFIYVFLHDTDSRGKCRMFSAYIFEVTKVGFPSPRSKCCLVGGYAGIHTRAKDNNNWQS